jgi:hypothetical protein
MTPEQFPNPTEANPVIRVASVCGPETTVLADSLETLLAETKGFTCSRFEYCAESGVKPNATGFGDPDVAVAALGSFLCLVALCRVICWAPKQIFESAAFTKVILLSVDNSRLR